MSKKPDQHALQRLRAAAEAQLAGVPPAGMPVHPAGELLHELRVHQIELKMQNDELRRAQLAMEESRDRYLDLYDFAPVGYLTLTREALISEINLTGAALLGKARGKLVHSRFARFVAPEDSDRWHLHFMRTLQHGDRQGCELALRRADGSRFDARLDCLYLVKEGNAPAVRIILTDITERKQAEAGRLLRQIFDMPFIGMAVTSPATKRWRDCNARLCEILGYSREELAEKNWLEMTHPDDMEASVAEFERVMRGESECYRMDKRFIRKDGAVVFVTIDEKCVRKPDGTVDYFVKMVQDITERKHAQFELQRSQALLAETQRLGKLGSWELDRVSGELRWSDEIYRIFELDPAKFLPSYENFLNAIHPDDRDKVDQAYTRSLQDRQTYDIAHRLLFADGRIKWVREHCSSDFDASGKPLRSVGAVQDITEQRLAEDRLRVAAVTFEAHDAILITDTSSNIIRVNQAFQDITGYSAEEVLGKNPRMMNSGRQDKAFYAEMWQQLLRTGAWSGEIWDRRKNGQVYPKWLTITAIKNEQGETTEYVAIFSDITARKQAEEEIRHLAFYDALTKLPNRRLLLDRFHLALSVSARSHHYGAVLFLDMDKFKTLNDTLGHHYGDLMLIEVAQRIQLCVREVDTVARLGGDEFVVLIDEIGTNAEEASQRVALIAEKMRAALAVPYQLKGHEYHSSPSIGVCLYCGNEESVDTLLKHADLAMYQAKDAGRNAVRFFDPAMQHAVEIHVALEADLRRAIPNLELRLYYQIQVDNERRPLGAEALVRWMHPKRGMVSPAQFIPVAEESSLILDIGLWVLDTACRQLARWGGNEQTRNLELAINVSAQQFRLHGFVDVVAAALRAHQVAPSRLKLELTESVVLNDVADVVAKMHALKALGVKLSLDDFGTGYSSLSYLKQLPLDQIKIDQSFVRDIATDPNDAVMVKTIIDMAQNFRLNVIAEGVETEAQLGFLRQNGCMAYQGYLFSKPVPVGEFEKLLGKGD